MREGGGTVAVKKLSKKSVARSDSVWRGPKGRSQLPLEINRRSGQSHSTRIGLEEQQRVSSGGWEQLIEAYTNMYDDIRWAWGALEGRERVCVRV